MKKHAPSSLRAIATAVVVASLTLAVSAAFAADTDAPAGVETCAALPCSVVISGDLADKPATRGPALDRADIAIGNHEMFSILTNAGGFTIAERERIVYMRLTEIISNVRVRPSAFGIVSVRGKPTICVGPYRLITVYPNDAAAAGCTADELAAEWMGSLMRELPWVTPINNVAYPPREEPAPAADAGG